MRGQRFDTALAIALGALYTAEALGESGFAGHRAVGLIVGLVFMASLAVRRRWPVVPIAVAVFVIEFANLVGPNAMGDTAALLFAIVITIYSVGAYARGHALWVAIALIVAAIPLAAIEPGQSTSASDIGFFVMFFGGPFVAGRVIRLRRERETQLESEGEERARAAVTEERTRIARELHDVIAHAVSVVVLQARGARKQVSPEQSEVREALDTIEHSASEALTEMRRLLSLLREHDEELALAPQPSLRRVDALAERARAAGLAVELKVEGSLDDLPAGIDVSAYRIVQEALTNALKHAGPAHATVHITRGEQKLAIEVSDDGRGQATAEAGGHGLVGMRERVAVYGGWIEAGPRPQGHGFALRVELPLEGAA
ncbi:MAG TPA: sensor histidine kinase [Thermoleophilaceae bacterium]|nr:sensor histidine kinase [Thermoleophilaceae bacterium]